LEFYLARELESWDCQSRIFLTERKVVVGLDDIKNQAQKVVSSVPAREVANGMLLTPKHNDPPDTADEITEPKPKLWLILCLLLLTIAFALFFVLT
jgi:hypothetical protein